MESTTTQLNYKNKSDAVHFRRTKRKIDGINVSIPTDVTNTEVHLL